MPSEKRNGVRIQTRIAVSLKKKFKAKCKRENITPAEVMRNLIQGFVSGK